MSISAREVVMTWKLTIHLLSVTGAVMAFGISKRYLRRGSGAVSGYSHSLGVSGEIFGTY